MLYVEAPHELSVVEPSQPRLFLAGGISDCFDWQQSVVKMLEGTPLTLFNPRRSAFDLNDPLSVEAQIEWEHRHLRVADAILFWFPSETLCPITLYELGTWSISDKPLFLGIDPEYQRRIDVEIQTRLVRPTLQPVYDIKTLVQQVREWAKSAHPKP